MKSLRKAVLASIKPKYRELIASGLKTVELRKTCPKIDTPFKCYIYQTKGKWIYKILEWLGLYQGKVIGEFVCYGVSVIYPTGGISTEICTRSCLTAAEITSYQAGKWVFAWHISDLKIYDEPKELGEFCKPCDPLPGCFCDYCKGHGRSPSMMIQRPPQSWCFVEDLEVTHNE